LLLVVQNKYIH